MNIGSSFQRFCCPIWLCLPHFFTILLLQMTSSCSKLKILLSCVSWSVSWRHRLVLRAALYFKVWRHALAWPDVGCCLDGDPCQQVQVSSFSDCQFCKDFNISFCSNFNFYTPDLYTKTFHGYWQMFHNLFQCCCLDISDRKILLNRS